MQPDIEQGDAKKVDLALNHMHEKNIHEPKNILRDVCSRCPDKYQDNYSLRRTIDTIEE